ncbi:MAG: phosphopentomutase [Clostridia bacterium]|nr:phosphopentomutase [Clostridia bacterium]
MKSILIVLDSLGAGALPDAAAFGDAGAHTIKSISKSPHFAVPNLQKMGLGNIEGLEFLGASDAPKASYGRAMERSQGKDTTIGHWELAGVVSERPLPTFPDGFPQELLQKMEQAWGRGILCNRPYSGTEVIRDYGDEMVQTGKLIVYTSADSVFQIAAHEEIVPLEELYEICRKAREILKGEWGVGRVIARPFIGESGNYTRTANRRDFSLEPPQDTLLDILQKKGVSVTSVGKIVDIFAERGIDRAIRTHSNTEGMNETLRLVQEGQDGLIFLNLVDFDMIYGHRQDVDGYAKALAEFDGWLPQLLAAMEPEDRLIITADHGCDPADQSTDHTREYIPILVYSPALPPRPLGTRQSFSDVGQTIAGWYDTALTEGERML